MVTSTLWQKAMKNRDHCCPFLGHLESFNSKSVIRKTYVVVSCLKWVACQCFFFLDTSLVESFFNDIRKLVWQNPFLLKLMTRIMQAAAKIIRLSKTFRRTLFYFAFKLLKLLKLNYLMDIFFLGICPTQQTEDVN